MSPPPVRRKGASKIVKTTTRSRSARLAFPPSLVTPSLSRLDWTEAGEREEKSPQGRPVAGLAGLLRPPALPLSTQGISTRRTRRPTHPIPPQSIPEQRQSKEKAQGALFGTELQEEKESLGVFLFFPGSSGGSCRGGEDLSFEVFLGAE